MTERIISLPRPRIGTGFNVFDFLKNFFPEATKDLQEANQLLGVVHYPPGTFLSSETSRKIINFVNKQQS